MTTEEKLGEIDLGMDPQKPRPILINSKFRDIFTWEYSEMLGLDPGLVVHTLNVEPGAKLVAQLARVFHTDMEKEIIKEVQKLLVVDLSSRSNTRDGYPILYL